MKKVAFLLLCVSCMSPALAQIDSVNTLDTIVITDNKLRDFSVGQTLTRLSDSVVANNKPALTSLLNFNTPIYFKENGLGMVSSPSFRGTTASQTAVLWNGLNINSQFNGQTDFNTINTGSYDHISLRSGGGSVAYGTGAIGGTVHLNTDLVFQNGQDQASTFDNQLHLGYGSFNTLDARYRIKASSKNVAFRFSVVRNSSDNDYAYQNRDGKNLNGQFHNTALNAAVAFRLNKKNRLNFYSELYESERHFSLIRPSENKTKYNDLNTRNLLEWESRFGRFKSVLKGAFLSENYKYYPNIEVNSHTEGKAETLIGKYDLSFKPSQDVLLNGILSHKHTNGFGTDVEQNVRTISSAGVLFKHQAAEKLRYQLGFRKEVTDSYESPFLYSAGLDYRFFPFYTAKLSVSKNFRRPTYNDLYWTNSGNPDLKAEESNQVELGNAFSYKNWELTLTGYFNDIDNMIHWLPNSSGIFTPRNTDHVQTYGGEALLNWTEHFNEQTVGLNATYAYTISENVDTHKQLRYVPYHKATFSATYGIGRFSVDYQFLFNGEVFTRSDNDSKYNLDSYSLSNVGIAYKFGTENTYKIGGRLRNIFDKAYENVENREMPGINFNFYLTLNF